MSKYGQYMCAKCSKFINCYLETYRYIEKSKEIYCEACFEKSKELQEIWKEEHKERTEGKWI